MRGETLVKKLFDGVTAASTTSEVIDIKGADKVTLICQRTDHSAGNSKFSAEVGVGGAYADYKKWIYNDDNTNSESLARIDELTLDSNAVDFLSMSPEDAFEFIKVVAKVAIDGKASAWLVIDYK